MLDGFPSNTNVPHDCTKLVNRSTDGGTPEAIRTRRLAT
jgi:hypothetical protein